MRFRRQARICIGSGPIHFDNCSRPALLRSTYCNNKSITMKKFIVCLTLAGLASLQLAQAGEGKSSPTGKPATTVKVKATSSAKMACSENAGCSTSAQTSCTDKSSCCEKEKVARKVAKPDEKGATFLVRR